MMGGLVGVTESSSRSKGLGMELGISEGKSEGKSDGTSDGTSEGASDKEGKKEGKSLGTSVSSIWPHEYLKDPKSNKYLGQYNRLIHLESKNVQFGDAVVQ